MHSVPIEYVSLVRAVLYGKSSIGNTTTELRNYDYDIMSLELGFLKLCQRR